MSETNGDNEVILADEVISLPISVAEETWDLALLGHMLSNIQTDLAELLEFKRQMDDMRKDFEENATGILPMLMKMFK